MVSCGKTVLRRLSCFVLAFLPLLNSLPVSAQEADLLASSPAVQEAGPQAGAESGVRAEPNEAFQNQDKFSESYTAVTKKILLASIALERLSLNYRLGAGRRPLVDKLVFIGTQEAGAASGLAFEIIGDEQFNRGRKNLLRLNTAALGRGLRAAETGSIVAASGSTYMLMANFAHYARARGRGLDTASANKKVAVSLAELDKLLSERQSLVAANSGHPAYGRAVVEGKILNALRAAFVNEYSQFSTNTTSAATTENLFFLLNASYNIIGAVAADVGHQAIKSPHLNGPSNILFTVSGAMAIAAPLICSAQLWAQRKYLAAYYKRKYFRAGESLGDLPDLCKQLESLKAESGALMPSLPHTERMALYSQSSDLFVKQLENESATIRQFNKVALQSSIMGPVIGSLLTTQGVLGTRGYYHFFPSRPRKQLDLNYRGAVCGTVGTSMAVLGNASWLLASLVYERRLRREKRLPEQLIRSRLEHLDNLEKLVIAL